MYNQRDGRQERKFYGPRINFHIRVPEIRVSQDGKQLGIMPTDQARQLALDQGLDLVEMVAHAKPPVCQIMDYGKYKYEQKIKERQQAKKQREAEIHYKEIRLGPATAIHDLQTKANHVKEFIKDGDKVQVVVKFKTRRELSLKEQGISVLEKFLDMTKDFASLEANYRFEGKSIICKLGPKNS